MLYWGIKPSDSKENIGYKEFPDDQIVFYDGLYGTPSYLIWHAASWPERPKDFHIGKLFTFITFLAGKEREAHAMEFVIKNIVFDMKTQMFRIYAESALHNYLDSIEVLESVNVSETPISGVSLIKKILKDYSERRYKEIQVNAPINLKDRIKYTDFVYDEDMSLLDIITKICAENGWEFRLGVAKKPLSNKRIDTIFIDETLSYNSVYATPTHPDAEHMKHIENGYIHNITTEAFGATPMMLYTDIGRVLWTKIYLGESSLMTLCIQEKNKKGKYPHVTEDDFVDTLVGESRNIGLHRIAKNYKQFPVIIGKIYGKFTSDHKNKYTVPKFGGDIKNFSKDLDKRKFKKVYSTDYPINEVRDNKQTTPYAGNNVGMLFPQDESYRMLFSPDGEKDVSLIGPAYFGAEDNIPFRTDEKDFRLQFANGWVMYVDKDGNTIIQTAGANVNAEPAGDNDETYLKLNTDGTIDIHTKNKGQNVRINEGDTPVATVNHRHGIETHTHDMSSHTHQVAPGALIPGPPTNTLPASPSTTQPDSTSYTNRDADKESDKLRVVEV